MGMPFRRIDFSGGEDKWETPRVFTDDGILSSYFCFYFAYLGELDWIGSDRAGLKKRLDLNFQLLFQLLVALNLDLALDSVALQSFVCPSSSSTRSDLLGGYVETQCHMQKHHEM